MNSLGAYGILYKGREKGVKPVFQSQIVQPGCVSQGAPLVGWVGTLFSGVEKGERGRKGGKGELLGKARGSAMCGIA